MKKYYKRYKSKLTLPVTLHCDDVVLRSILRHHDVTSSKPLIEKSCVRH